MSMEEMIANLGKRVHHYRAKKDLTLKELAERVGARWIVRALPNGVVDARDQFDCVVEVIHNGLQRHDNPRESESGTSPGTSRKQTP